MIVEIDDAKLAELEEERDAYLALLSKYNDAFIVKNELIKRYEKELKYSKQALDKALELLRDQFDDRKTRSKIQAIRKSL